MEAESPYKYIPAAHNPKRKNERCCTPKFNRLTLYSVTVFIIFEVDSLSAELEDGDLLLFLSDTFLFDEDFDFRDTTFVVVFFSTFSALASCFEGSSASGGSVCKSPDVALFSFNLPLNSSIFSFPSTN